MFFRRNGDPHTPRRRLRGFGEKLLFYLPAVETVAATAARRVIDRRDWWVWARSDAIFAFYTPPPPAPPPVQRIWRHACDALKGGGRSFTHRRHL